MSKTKSGSEVSGANVYLIGAVAALAGLLFGFDTGVISGAQEFILSNYKIDTEGLKGGSLQGLLVAAVPIGAFMGAMVSGFFAHRLGRRKSIMFTALLFLVGTILAAFAFCFSMVVFGRLTMGFAIGVSAMVVPMYLGEISPPHARGTIVFLFQLAITLGLLTAFATNLYFSQLIADPELNWRWMFGVGVVPAVVLYMGMYYMPYSPRWLKLQGRDKEAKETLQRLLGKKDVSLQIKEIDESLANEGASGWGQMFRKPLLPLVGVAFGLFVFQQLSGINAIMYYGPNVFEMAGFGEDAKFMAQLLMGLTNVLATVLGVSIVDKVGRRPLLFSGFAGMIVCLFVLSWCLNSHGDHPYISLTSVLLYIVFFAYSLGGIPYVMMSEVFPLRARAHGMAIASCANWGFNMIVSFSFGLLVNAMGSMGNVFTLYGVCTVIGLYFAWWFVPETRNRNLEEIEQNLYQGKSVREIGGPVTEQAS